jgi:hypothetical protein
VVCVLSGTGGGWVIIDTVCFWKPGGTRVVVRVLSGTGGGWVGVGIAESMWGCSCGSRLIGMS